MSTDNDTPPATSAATTAAQKHNPLHGLTLEYIVTELVAGFGWQNLGERIDIRCFTQDPSVASSLKFLRKTPWARAKVESLYLFMRREQKRAHQATQPQQASSTSMQPAKPKADPNEPVFSVDSPARTIAQGEVVADADGSADDVDNDEYADSDDDARDDTHPQRGAS